VTSNTGAAFSVVGAGVSTRAIHGFVGSTRHFATLSFISYRLEEVSISI
jgi:hypothetical protein